ncbi:hypothetical protein ANN_18142 [Periplaneta americana]|uniref:Uncharacterized protein n=1 Tax=Periplaneta americana TaxID=6978 RepID=A0ABQ8SP34_PERAM|nr:hypothetical protein ANN_18142 [Periplaneta americana]
MGIRCGLVDKASAHRAENPGSNPVYQWWSLSRSLGGTGALHFAPGKLYAKNMNLSNVMDVVVRTINFIRSKGLNHREFRALLDDINSEYGDLLYHTEVSIELWQARKTVFKVYNYFKNVNEQNTAGHLDAGCNVANAQEMTAEACGVGLRTVQRILLVKKTGMAHQQTWLLIAVLGMLKILGHKSFTEAVVLPRPPSSDLLSYSRHNHHDSGSPTSSPEHNTLSLVIVTSSELPKQIPPPTQPLAHSSTPQYHEVEQQVLGLPQFKLLNVPGSKLKWHEVIVHKNVFWDCVKHVAMQRCHITQLHDGLKRSGKALLHRYQREGGDFLGRIVAMDETWTRSYEPNLKCHPGSPRPKKVRPTQSAVKVMFIVACDIDGVILHHAVPPRQTENADYWNIHRTHPI